MSEQRWQRIERLFTRALPLSHAARHALLLRACGSDTALRAEVESLLDSVARSDGFLEAVPGHKIPPTARPGLAPGTAIGAWRVQGLVGSGGMGDVYEVVRNDAQMRQRAALKIVRNATAGSLDRFRAEREILARLDHPGIARLLDGGLADTGEPYAVVEFVDGMGLVEHCRARASTLDQRLLLIMQVCDAVAHAHRHLVVHRDLKPANILVDADERVHLLDFGIAKMLDPGAWIGGAETQFTHRPLTPDYCAPEQLTGEPVTTATDIHAIGVLLFELLAGERPWAPQRLPVQRALRALLDTPAPRPSDVAARSGTAPVPPRNLRGDLDAIVARCLRREPQLRYETVEALRLDIERHRARRPVAARNGQRAYAFGRFLRRHWAPAVAAIVLVATLSAAVVHANIARNRTEAALRTADTIRGFVVDLFALNEPERRRGRRLDARELVDLGARRAEEGLGEDPETRIELLGVVGTLYESLGEYDRSAAVFAARLDAAERHLGVADTRLVQARLDVAGSELKRERFTQARRMLQDVLASLPREHADFPLLRARALAVLAQLEDGTGNHAGAVELGHEAVALLRGSGVTSGEQLASTLVGLGRYTFSSGNPGAAEAPLRQALAAIAGSGTTSTLVEARYLLSVVLSGLARFDEARAMLQPNIEWVRRVFGAEHALLADQLFERARIDRLDGHAARAIDGYRQALAIYERAYGSRHSFVATTLTGLGQALAAEDQYRLAIESLERADRIYLETLGARHQFAATSASALAEARLASGDAIGAERGFRVAMARYVDSGNGGHVYVEAARRGLGEALVAQGRHAEAEPLLRQARQRLADAFGEGDYRTAQAALSLVRCLAGSGRDGEARDLLVAVGEALPESGSRHASVAADLDAARLELEGMPARSGARGTPGHVRASSR